MNALELKIFVALDVRATQISLAYNISMLEATKMVEEHHLSNLDKIAKAPVYDTLEFTYYASAGVTPLLPVRTRKGKLLYYRTERNGMEIKIVPLWFNRENPVGWYIK